MGALHHRGCIAKGDLSGTSMSYNTAVAIALCSALFPTSCQDCLPSQFGLNAAKRLHIVAKTGLSMMRMTDVASSLWGLSSTLCKTKTADAVLKAQLQASCVACSACTTASSSPVSEPQQKGQEGPVVL